MKLTLAGRRSPVRAVARPNAARYAPTRGYDDMAAYVALLTTLCASLVLVLCAIVLRG